MLEDHSFVYRNTAIFTFIFYYYTSIRSFYYIPQQQIQRIILENGMLTLRENRNGIA